MNSTNKTAIRYEELPLHRHDLLVDPTDQFGLWYEQATAQGEWDPSAMTLATVDKDYHVTARMLLLKEFSIDGFVFFTNYDSPKAKALEEVPNAAMVFWWSTCQRQVRITGKVVRASKAQSDAYFASRPIGSQVAAIISKQSDVISSREELLAQYQEAEDRLTHSSPSQSTLERPDNWGGYVLKPTSFEFWQGRTHRLHDRFEYRKFSTGWEIEQLYP